jgi:hypothetical protein
MIALDRFVISPSQAPVLLSDVDVLQAREPSMTATALSGVRHPLTKQHVKKQQDMCQQAGAGNCRIIAAGAGR